MKNGLIAKIVIILSICFLYGCSTSSLSDTNTMPDVTNLNVPIELLDLRFDNYEKMSVAEYRDKVLECIATDEADYFSLLDNIGEDIEDMSYSEEDSYFILNILVPTIADKWNEWRFNNNIQKEGCIVEYTISYKVKDPENITMDERNHAISTMIITIEDTLNTSTQEQLLNEKEIQKSLENEMLRLEEQVNNISFEIKTELSYRVVLQTSGVDLQINQVPFDEKRDIKLRENVGTEEDYNLLLSLKTDGYSEMSVEEFLQSYIDIAQLDNFQEAYTKVLSDISLDDIQVDISKEELNFITTTLEATSQEFIAKYHSENKKPELRCRIEKQNFDAVSGRNAIVFNLFIDYILNYTVMEEDEYTIAERDKVLRSVKEEINKFIDQQNEDKLINEKSRLEDEIERIVQQFSNDKIQINIDIISFQTQE